jgi:cell division protease FtsH
MVEECYNKAKVLLTDNREKLNQLAEILLLKEVIFREDLEKIFGKRPFADHDHVMINSNGDTNEYLLAESTGETTAETIAVASDAPAKAAKPDNLA